MEAVLSIDVNEKEDVSKLTVENRVEELQSPGSEHYFDAEEANEAGWFFILNA